MMWNNLGLREILFDLRVDFSEFRGYFSSYKCGN